MNSFIRQWGGAAALVLAAFSPQTKAATVIDFEGDALTGLYSPGDSFSQSGFTMTQGFDFGTVDKAASLPNAPSGNLTQFYFNSNLGDMLLTRGAGRRFNLDGFSAAFVPIDAQLGQTIVLVAFATDGDGNQFATAFGLGSGNNGSFPFLTYNDPLDFGRFTNLVSVNFFGCAFTGNFDCSAATIQNNGQFALDDIRLTAIPEPTTTALLALGLLGLAVASRRRVR